MIKKTMVLGTLLSAVIFTLGATETFADSTGIVTTSKLNVRSGPSTKYKVIGSLKKNNNVTILSSSNGWHKVRLSNNKEGWATSQYIKTGSSSNNSNNSNTNGQNNSNAGKTGVVTTSKLNVRSGPSTKNSVVGSLSRNSNVTILSSSNGWHKVRLSNNKEGWASSQYIKIGQSSNTNGSTNGSSTDKKKMKVVATAYTGYSTTSTGQKPVWGTIAVDPKVIPYGTKVYIPQFDQVFVANNTGGAIKGNKIDIFMNTKKQCYDWGRRTIDIEILGK